MLWSFRFNKFIKLYLFGYNDQEVGEVHFIASAVQKIAS